MINHRSRESFKFFGSLVDPQNAEHLQRTKTEIENSIKKILKHVQNESQSTKDGKPTVSRKERELVGLIEDLQKQQQSLYVAYDRVTEEFGKVVSRRKFRRASGSSSDSDSEYFSSEEVDANKRRAEKEHYYVSYYNTPKQELDKSDDRTEAMELEGQLTSLMKEMESLHHKKKNLQVEVESQTHEAEQLRAKNTELHHQILEIELLLKDAKSVAFDLQEKVNNNEDLAKSNVANLMAKINVLELEVKSLHTKKDEMEEQIKCDKSEASAQREDLMNQLNVMQQNLDSLENQNKELEVQMEGRREEISQHLLEIENLKDKLAEVRSAEQNMNKELEVQVEGKREETSQHLLQIENLKGNLAEMRSVEQNMLEEKEGLLAMLKNLELELETQSSQKNELEEQLSYTSYENKQLEDKNKALQDRNHELRTAMTQQGEDISGFLTERENHKNGASMEVMTLKAEVNALRLELDSLHEQKNKLEQQNERNQKEYAESVAKMDTLNAKLVTQMDDQERKIEQLSEENKQDKILCNKLRLNYRTAERKMEELAEKFRKKMEDNIRLLHQRIHVAEQLNNENKNSCRMTKQRYEEENKELGERIRKLKEDGSGTPSALAAWFPNGFEMAGINELDLATEKVEEHMRRVTRITYEVEFAKEWTKERNNEVKELKEKVDYLGELLNKKEEQELLFREKVWSLEAKVSKEGGEKLNLTKAVNKLEKKVARLEKNLKEKDEELVNLADKKREAIRQLCLVVDFHRDRFNYLKDLVISRRFNNTI